MDWHSEDIYPSCASMSQTFLFLENRSPWNLLQIVVVPRRCIRKSDVSCAIFKSFGLKNEIMLPSLIFHYESGYFLTQQQIKTLFCPLRPTWKLSIYVTFLLSTKWTWFQEMQDVNSGLSLDSSVSPSPQTSTFGSLGCGTVQLVWLAVVHGVTLQQEGQQGRPCVSSISSGTTSRCEHSCRRSTLLKMVACDPFFPSTATSRNQSSF